MRTSGYGANCSCCHQREKLDCSSSRGWRRECICKQNSLAVVHGTPAKLGENQRLTTEANLGQKLLHVRFTPESGHLAVRSKCPLSVKSRHRESLDAGLPMVVKLSRQIGGCTHETSSAGDDGRDLCSLHALPIA